MFPTLTDRCPECGETVDVLDSGSHVVFDRGVGHAPVILVGCEEYFLIDPHLIGMRRRGWQPYVAEVTDPVCLCGSVHVPGEANVNHPIITQLPDDASTKADV